MESSPQHVVDSDPGAPDGADQVKELLQEHVPLSLIMDLTSPDGPPSRDILATEGAPDGAWWEKP